MNAQDQLDKALSALQWLCALLLGICVVFLTNSIFNFFGW